jgi:FG-GAP-like repeat
MRHRKGLPSIGRSSGLRISQRRRRELRRIFTLVFVASAASAPLAARPVPFGPPQTISSTTGFAFAVFSADLDGDGDLDVLTAALAGDTIAWHENADGLGGFGPERPLSTTADGAYSVFAADLDGDGDLDVVAAAADGDEVAWYANTDGLGNFEGPHLIETVTDRPSGVFAADIDGDGDLDVVATFYNAHSIAWYENTDGGGHFGTQQLISSAVYGVYTLFVADLDGDGDLDVVTGGSADDTVVWFENTDGQGGFGDSHVLTTAADGLSRVAAADVDGDGDLDVLSTSAQDHKIAWYANTDGQGGFGGQQVVSTEAINPYSVVAADIDSDGDADLVATSSSLSHLIVWYENTDGAGSFGSQQVLSTTAAVPRQALAVDVVTASAAADNVAWSENETIHRSAAFPAASVITSETDGPHPALAADLDGDGDLDVVSASLYDSTVAWYANTDGMGGFGSQQLITSAFNNPWSIVAADVDGDGALDLVAAGPVGVAWFANTDGAGGFGDQQTISTVNNYAVGVFAADLDGDGDLDVLSASIFDDKIAWYANTDGAGDFGTQQVISTLADFPETVFAADVDGDGDLDVLSSSRLDHEIAWYENTDGAGGFGTQQVIAITDRPAHAVFAADVDGDGDIDALSAEGQVGDGAIAWYENTDGLGGFSAQQVISTEVGEAFWVSTADLDGDGDLDVLSSSYEDGKIAWYENTDGQGGFGPQQVLTTLAADAWTASAADLDRDGDLDVLYSGSAVDEVAWLANRGGQFSLATLDTAQQVVGNSQLHDLLKITVTHQGRAGDSDVELAALELRFTDGAGVPAALAETEVAALIQELRLYLDDGSGTFDGADGMAASTTDFSSITTNGDGVLTWTLLDDIADLQVPFSASKSYFVVAQMTTDAESQSPGSFAATHRTESSSRGEDASADIPLSLEYAPDATTATIDTTLSSATCKAPFELELAERTVGAPVTCEAGTVLTTGANLVVMTPGALTLRAGQAIDFADGLAVESGSLSAEIDPGLEP